MLAFFLIVELPQDKANFILVFVKLAQKASADRFLFRMHTHILDYLSCLEYASKSIPSR